MSKAVLILNEMPDTCTECQFSIYAGRYYCTTMTRELIGYPFINRPDWCPLKALPEKMDICGTYDAEYRAKGGWMPSMKIGWNKCVEYLLGEKEKENE